MIIDTHAHLYLDQFAEDIDLVMERSESMGIQKILLPNIDRSTISPMMGLAEMYPQLVQPMIGLHPCSVQENWEEELAFMEEMITMDEVCGIGETGIDLYWDKTYVDEQVLSFQRQIDWARQVNKPIVIHSRESLELTSSIISEQQDGNLTGVFHCFTGDLETAHKIMDSGFMMGIGGVITYRKAQEVRDVVEQVPLEFIVLETDAPYLSPVPFRGKRNESSYLTHIVQTISEVKGVSAQEIVQVTSRNAKELFKL